MILNEHYFHPSSQYLINPMLYELCWVRFKVKLFIMENGLTFNVSVGMQKLEILPTRVWVSHPLLGQFCSKDRCVWLVKS